MGIVLSIVLFNQSKYTEAAALTTLSDEVSLRLSEAQIYGIAVKELSPGSSSFSSGYGIAFSLLGSGSTTAYIIFADLNGNHIYDGTWSCTIGVGSECLERVDITRGNYIDNFCNLKNNGTNTCVNTKRIDVTFLRPNTAASIIFFNSGGQQYSPANLIGAQVIFKSPSGLSRTTSVYLSGQVASQ